MLSQTEKDNDIDVAWNEAEEIHSGLNEMTDDEIIECKTALIDRTKAIMSRLHPYASQERILLSIKSDNYEG